MTYGLIAWFSTGAASVPTSFRKVIVWPTLLCEMAITELSGLVAFDFPMMVIEVKLQQEIRIGEYNRGAVQCAVSRRTQASFYRAHLPVALPRLSARCRRFTTLCAHVQNSGPAKRGNVQSNWILVLQVLREACGCSIYYRISAFRQTSRKAPESWCRVRAADGRYPCRPQR